MSIYYASQVLQRAEKRYQTMEKLALALINSTRWLRQYFQSHMIPVKTDHPLKQVLRKLELSQHTYYSMAHFIKASQPS